MKVPVNMLNAHTFNAAILLSPHTKYKINIYVQCYTKYYLQMYIYHVGHYRIICNCKKKKEGKTIAFKRKKSSIYIAFKQIWFMYAMDYYAVITKCEVGL